MDRIVGERKKEIQKKRLFLYRWIMADPDPDPDPPVPPVADPVTSLKTAFEQVMATAPNKIVMNPEVFDGTGNVKDWLATYDTATTINGWDNVKAAAYIPGYLRGKALHYYNSLTEKGIEDVKKALEKRFSPNERVQFSKFEHAVQGAESIDEYGSRVMQLLIDGMPGKPKEQLEPFAVQKFCNGLNNVYVKQRLFEDNPTDMVTAVKQAKTYAEAAAMAGAVGGLEEDSTDVSKMEVVNTVKDVPESESERGRGRDRIKRGVRRPASRGRGRGRGGLVGGRARFGWICKCGWNNDLCLDNCGKCRSAKNTWKCRGCGEKDNFANKKECFRCQTPRYQQEVCRKCQKPGHWAAQCPELN